MDYVSNKDLKKWVRSWRKSGEMPGELVEAVRAITEGVCSRYCRGFDLDEANQFALLRVFLCKDKMRLSGNLFNYITTVVVNEIRQKWRNSKKWRQAVQWVEGCVNGKPRPDADEKARQLGRE